MSTKCATKYGLPEEVIFFANAVCNVQPAAGVYRRIQAYRRQQKKNHHSHCTEGFATPAASAEQKEKH